MPTQRKRTIRTDYYGDHAARKLVRTNRAAFADSAVLHCIDHMQSDRYDALLAEVFDEVTGTLHAVIKRSIGKDQIHIVFKRNPQEGGHHGG